MGRWWRVPVKGYGHDKEQAVQAYRSQTTDLTGEPGWSYLPPSFVRHFRTADALFLPPVAGGKSYFA